MKTLRIVLAATVLLTTTLTAPAFPADNDLRSTAQQRLDMEGTYLLENGQRAKIFELDNRLYIDLERRHRKELLLVAPDLFASPDGAVSVQFQRDDPDAPLLFGIPYAAPNGAPVRLAADQVRTRGH